MDEYRRKNFLIILIAPSGGGKSTIGKQIYQHNKNIEYSISYTTRSPRGDEVDGKDYFFISETEFKQRTEDGDFLEYAYVHGNWYGTSKSFIKKRLDKGFHILLDIDVHGAIQITGSGINAVTIFILPPTADILRQRLIDRGTDSLSTINTRLNNARDEIKAIDNFQYLVINDDLDIAVQTVMKIIEVEENRVVRYEKIYQTFYNGE